MHSIARQALVVMSAVLAAAILFAVTKDDAEGKAPAPRRRVLKGTIKLKGELPDLKALNKQIEEEMRKKDTDYCQKCDETEKTQQVYRLGGRDNRRVGNVFVWITPEAASGFEVSDKQLDEAKKREVILRQPHCAFIPHCNFLFSQYHSDPSTPRNLKPTGQVLKIVNDAEISHNVNCKGGRKNKGENVILAPRSERTTTNLVPELEPVVIGCNIHPWMSAYLWVVDTPYYAISHSDTLDGKDKVARDDARFGTYEIPNPPAGKVRIRAWHEKAGWLNKDGAKGEVIEVKASDATSKDFEMTAK